MSRVRLKSLARVYNGNPFIAGKIGICARPVPFFFSLQSHLLEVGDVPQPSVSCTGAGSHTAQSVIIACSHIVIVIVAYPRESIPILRQIFQAGECRKVKYSVLFLVVFYYPVFLDIGHIGVKVEGVVP